MLNLREGGGTQVLDFWFGPVDEAGLPAAEKMASWWQAQAAFDKQVQEKFGALLNAAAASELDEWLHTARGRLALIVVLDQFSRNIFRNSWQAFSQDAAALAHCLEGMRNRSEQELLPVQRIFFFMPLMHSEDIEMQRISVEKYAQLKRECRGTAQLLSVVSQSADFACRHLEIIEKFGRYPHRNAILRRVSSPAETEFLQQPGSSF